MTEDRVGFLYKLACNISSNNNTLKTLKSYYLMRCYDLTKGCRLPAKQFSSNVRCPRCCLEWAKGTEVKVQPLKLNKNNRRKMKSQKKDLNKNSKKSTGLLRRNEMVLVCSFCKQNTTKQLIKPEKEYIKMTSSKENVLNVNNKKKQEIKKVGNGKKAKINKKFSTTKPEIKRSAVVNVYSNAMDVFSLKNEKNTLLSAIKEPLKVIKNNKKKKDKFAGLCQKAVLASAKLKQQKTAETQKQMPQNKLNMFLKPSSG